MPEWAVSFVLGMTTFVVIIVVLFMNTMMRVVPNGRRRSA